MSETVVVKGTVGREGEGEKVDLERRCRRASEQRRRRSGSDVVKLTGLETNLLCLFSQHY